MKRIYVIVEGKTEKLFVDRVLNIYFSPHNIYLTPIVVTTKKIKGLSVYKGGIRSYQIVKNEITRFISRKDVDFISTMIDFYKLPSDFPGYDKQPHTDCYKKVFYLEDKLAEDISHSGFIPYIQLHEFEAYLFSHIDGFNKVFFNRRRELGKIKKIISTYKSPEEINEGESTSPAKRIKAIFPEYSKVATGVLMAQYLGTDKIRKACPHFDDWIKKLLSTGER